MAKSFSQVEDFLQTTQHSSVISVDLASAFNKCIAESEGVWVYVDAKDETQFDVHFQLVTGVTQIVSTKWTVHVSNAQCDPFPDEVSSPQAVHCEKNSIDDTAVVTVKPEKMGTMDTSPSFPPYRHTTTGEYRISALAYGYGTRTTSKRAAAVAYFKDSDMTDADRQAHRSALVVTPPLDITDMIDSYTYELDQTCSVENAAEKPIDDKSRQLTFIINRKTMPLNNNYLPCVGRIFANIKTVTTVRSMPVALYQSAGKPYLDLNVAQYLDKQTDWKMIVFDVSLEDSAGQVTELFQHEDGTSQTRAGQFQAIVDPSNHLHIVQVSSP